MGEEERPDWRFSNIGQPAVPSQLIHPSGPSDNEHRNAPHLQKTRSEVIHLKLLRFNFQKVQIGNPARRRLVT